MGGVYCPKCGSGTVDVRGESDRRETRRFECLDCAASWAVERACLPHGERSTVERRQD